MGTFGKKRIGGAIGAGCADENGSILGTRFKAEGELFSGLSAD
jgi:hypothetical protein